jgi:hypothetical protein
MLHGINYIHGSAHYNSGILVFTDFADAIGHAGLRLSFAPLRSQENTSDTLRIRVASVSLCGRRNCLPNTLTATSVCAAAGYPRRTHRPAMIDG